MDITSTLEILAYIKSAGKPFELPAKDDQAFVFRTVSNPLIVCAEERTLNYVIRRDKVKAIAKIEHDFMSGVSATRDSALRQAICISENIRLSELPLLKGEV